MPAERRARAAERARLSRERRSRGVTPTTVDVSIDAIEALVRRGDLSDNDFANKATLARALGFALDDYAGVG